MARCETGSAAHSSVGPAVADGRHPRRGCVRLLLRLSPTISERRKTTMTCRTTILVATCVALGAFAPAALAAANAVVESETTIGVYDEHGKLIEVKTGVPDKFKKTSIAATKLTSTGDVFTGMMFSGVLCRSAGAAEGEVVTNPEIETLGWIDKAKDEVGLEERAKKKKGLLASFTCGSNTIELRGAVVGRLTPINTRVLPGEHFVSEFAITETGEQVYESLEGLPAVSIELQMNKDGFHRIAWGERDELSSETPYEVSTASGTPRFVKIKVKK
jgi:hypothetical protein